MSPKLSSADTIPKRYLWCEERACFHLVLNLRSQIVTLKIASLHPLAESKSSQVTDHYFFLLIGLAPWNQPDIVLPSRYRASLAIL